MNRSRTSLRYARIATTVVCLVVCILLIVLWVRSHSRRDECLGGFHEYLFAIDSLRGGIGFTIFDPSDEDIVVSPSFKTVSDPVTEFMMIRFHGLDAPPLLSALGFGWQFAASGFAISMPHWFVVLLSATLAALPWIKWRFSLRTLLIGMTIVAVACGTIAMVS